MSDRLEIDWQKVAQYLKAQCTAEEIAAVIGCECWQLEADCKVATGATFSEFSKRNYEAGKAMLKLWQFKAASEGDTKVIQTMTEKYITEKPGKSGGWVTRQVK